VGTSNVQKLTLGAFVVALMIFAFFCPPSSYKQAALIIGILCVGILVVISLHHTFTNNDYAASHWRLDPDCLFVGVIITDLNGNIQYTNTIARTLLPASTEETSIEKLYNDWHNELVNRQQADDVVQAVLAAPDLQFSETLHFTNGKVLERVTRALPNQASRLWILRDVSYIQSAHHDSEMHTTMVEADAARTAELAEQLFHAKAELEAKQAELTRLANTDSLTGLLNRRRFTALGERVVQNSIDDNIWVIMMDIDHFKRINDTYGHAAGDVAIRDFASIAARETGQKGFVGRMGGEEFACILENCDRDTAIVVAEAIRKATAKHQTISESEKIRFTCSIGVAQWQKGEISIEAALDRSDQALYSAKSFGRNRVVGYEVNEI